MPKELGHPIWVEKGICQPMANTPNTQTDSAKTPEYFSSPDEEEYEMTGGELEKLRKQHSNTFVIPVGK